MKKKKLLLIALLLVWVAPSFAAKVDTLLIKSPSMNKEVQVVVVTPDPPFIYCTVTVEMLKHGLT